MSENHAHPNKAQLVYAAVLHWVSTIGIVFVIAGFAAYVFGLLPATYPIEEIAGSWHLGSAELNHLYPQPTGWSWVSDILWGDVLSFSSIVYLSAATIVCLVAVAGVFISEKNGIYTGIAILQILVLLVAASGLIGSGH